MLPLVTEFSLSLPEFSLSLPEFSRFLKIFGGVWHPPHTPPVATPLILNKMSALLAVIFLAAVSCFSERERKIKHNILCYHSCIKIIKQARTFVLPIFIFVSRDIPRFICRRISSSRRTTFLSRNPRYTLEVRYIMWKKFMC